MSNSTRTCTEPGCAAKHTARGLCATHYQSKKLAGTLPPRLNNPEHNLSDVDLCSRTAVCRICGPVALVVLKYVTRCANKHAEERAKIREQRRNLTPEQQASRNAYHREYARARKFKLRVDAGVTEMLDRAGWQCEICKRPLDISSSHIDHDHTCCDSQYQTCGSCIRGILCSPCNTALGFLGDSPDVLIAAADYLRSFRIA